MARTRIARVRVVWSEDEANELLSDQTWDLLGAFPHPTLREVYYVLVQRVTVKD